MSRLGSLFTTAVLGAVSCSPPPAANPEGDRGEIRAVLEEHVRAVNESDLATILDGMTDDIVYLGPDMPVLRGKEAFRELAEPFYAAFDAEISMTPEELILNGDWAVEWGTLTGTTTPLAGGDSIPMDSKYLYVYRRDSDGRWRIARDIYNSNAPAPTVDEGA